jgi:molybdate transport system substrate-binding protein
MRRGLILLLFTLSIAACAQAADVTVAAASDLNFAIKEIIAGFEKATGHKVKLSLGSSGNFHTQILNGAPFQVFLSADVNYPRELEKAGKAEAGSVYIYALGKLVLWVPNASRLDIQGRQMKSLVDPSIKKISIANPAHAPYGRAALAAMQTAGVYEAVKNKLVFGENISQAAQFVQSGAADIGIVALSLAMGESMRSSGKFWELPGDQYPPIEQGIALVKPATPEARAFHDWVRRPETRQILARFGFGLR